MPQKLPRESFEYYVSLGPERSYQRVAERYGASKRAVVDHAQNERWMERLRRIEEEARQRSEAKLIETMEEQRTRHLRSLRLLNARAIEALKEQRFESALDAARALEIAIKHERAITGQPSHHAQVTIEEVTRREIDCMVAPEQDDDGDAPAG